MGSTVLRTTAPPDVATSGDSAVIVASGAANTGGMTGSPSIAATTVLAMAAISGGMVGGRSIAETIARHRDAGTTVGSTAPETTGDLIATSAGVSTVATTARHRDAGTTGDPSGAVTMAPAGETNVVTKGSRSIAATTVLAMAAISGGMVGGRSIAATIARLRDCGTTVLIATATSAGASIAATTGGPSIAATSVVGPVRAPGGTTVLAMAAISGGMAGDRSIAATIARHRDAGTTVGSTAPETTVASPDVATTSDLIATATSAGASIAATTGGPSIAATSVVGPVRAPGGTTGVEGPLTIVPGRTGDRVPRAGTTRPRLASC
ncbi:hypothetical protein [Saccharomonospora xinjiangensis]|uniref:hypothetical protein n=2 Tax=Saccharomonospora xinjiangensis TaxID=75294 RepID=UPI0039ED5227